VVEHSYTPESLDFATTYFWKVDEVGDAGTYAGDLWSFTTQASAAIEDFESYNDDDHRIYDSWIDGVTTKASGSTVGYMQAPFAEKTIVHGGGQSMPLAYDNAPSPYYSEAERTFDPVQDWTAHGADTLTVHFQGKPGAFLEMASGNILMGSAGADIWGTADEFRFAHKQLNGNGSIVARVENIANTNAWAKAGVMIRESLAPGSTHAMLVVSPTSGLGFQRRPTTGGASEHTAASGAAPRWVKVTRTGNVFTAQHSADGVTWVDVAVTPPVQIAMSAGVYIGLVTCSHVPGVLTSAEFSNVSATGAVTGSWQVETIGPAQPEGNAAGKLYVTLKDTGGKSKTITHPAGESASMLAGWNAWQIPLSEFNSAGVKMNAVKSITIGVGDRTSPTPGGAGLVLIDDITFGR
jgi:regulation of enolase protein 1 (concanavalin A-like superfamily)